MKLGARALPRKGGKDAASVRLFVAKLAPLYERRFRFSSSLHLLADEIELMP
jgi:hypothetical protein